MKQDGNKKDQSRHYGILQDVEQYKDLVKDIKTGRIIGRGTKRDGLYYIDEVVQSSTMMLAHGTTKREAWLWHRRLGHPSVSYLHTLFPDLFPLNKPRDNLFVLSLVIDKDLINLVLPDVRSIDGCWGEWVMVVGSGESEYEWREKEEDRVFKLAGSTVC
nr:putative ribonuclease H-like domain-containing protein [Tanacetum cinerariifolium]